MSGTKNNVIVATSSITASEIASQTGQNWYTITATELQVKRGFKTFVGYSLPSSGGTSLLKVHLYGDESAKLIDIEVADSGAFQMLPAFDYLDITNSTIDPALILLAE